MVAAEGVRRAGPGSRAYGDEVQIPEVQGRGTDHHQHVRVLAVEGIDALEVTVTVEAQASGNVGVPRYIEQSGRPT
jgi:hypothetical protein